MANSDHEARPDEDLHLAEDHRLRLVDVAGRQQHDEQRVVVSLQLRPLMRLDRILDCELVQLKLTRDSLELVLAGLVQAQPGHGVARLAGGVQLRQAVGLSRAPPVTVDRPIDDHAVTHPCSDADPCRPNATPPQGDLSAKYGPLDHPRAGIQEHRAGTLRL